MGRNLNIQKSPAGKPTHDGNNPNDSSSTSFYRNVSHGTSRTISETNFASNAVTELNDQQILLTKAIAAIFRYKTRKVGSTFWKWKFSPYSVLLHKNQDSISRDTTNIVIKKDSHSNQISVTDKQELLKVDPEAENLIAKYKLQDIVSGSIDQSKDSILKDTKPLRDVEDKKQAGRQSLDGVVLTDENIDESDGVEATIS